MRHAVTPFEVEEITGGKYVVIAAKTVERERRWKLFGKTRSGRFQTVTAYEMNPAERSHYASQID